MPDKQMKLLNDDERLKRIDNLEVTIEKTVIHNEIRKYLSFSEPIVIDKGLAGEINNYSIQYLEQYPAEKQFVNHIEEFVKDALLEGFCYFRDEYNLNEHDVESQFVSFDETEDNVNIHEPDIQ